MGCSLQIRSKGPLVIPADSGYNPPLSQFPENISLSLRDMVYGVRFMEAAGAIDPTIDSSKKRRQCAEGKVPGYKFGSNDSFVVTAQEAARIADVMASHDLFTMDFLTSHFPSFDPANYQHLGRTRELIALWVAFNRVASANDGYTTK
jgi:hypothetical protein